MGTSIGNAQQDRAAVLKQVLSHVPKEQSHVSSPFHTPTRR